MSSVLLVLLDLLILSSAQLPPSPPTFSWDTIQIFIHAQNESGALNETAAKYMASFPLATIEKAQGQNESHPVCPKGEKCQEDKIIAALQQIRSYSSDVRTVFYLNTVLNYPQYRLYTNFTGTNEKYLLHDDKTGDLIYYDTCHKNGPHQTIFDFSYNYTVNAWVNTVKYAMTKIPGVVDGIFGDKARATTETDFGCVNWTDKHREEWQNGHTSMIQQSMKIIYKYDKNRGVFIANEADLKGVNARMFQSWEPDDKDAVPSGESIPLLMNEAGVRITEVHAGEGCSFTPPNARYNSSLAAYLIAAVEYSYYMCVSGWTLQDGWDTANENPDFKKGLGEPLGNSTLKNGIYHREFKQGTKVWIDQTWNYPCIKWGDGSITGSAKNCSRYS